MLEYRSCEKIRLSEYGSIKLASGISIFNQDPSHVAAGGVVH